MFVYLRVCTCVCVPACVCAYAYMRMLADVIGCNGLLVTTDFNLLDVKVPYLEDLHGSSTGSNQHLCLYINLLTLRSKWFALSGSPGPTVHQLLAEA